MTNAQMTPAVPNHYSQLLRGGRMTKVAGQAASYAPSLGQALLGLSGSASALALGTVLFFGAGTAHAGICVETAPGSGIFTCSGAADPINDVSQNIQALSDLTITTETGFGIDTSAFDAFFIDIDDGNLTFFDENASDIIGAANGISVSAAGLADVTITTTGAVIGEAQDAINVSNGNGGGTSTGDEGGDIIISVVDATGQLDGIDANQNVPGSLSITATGDVTGTANDGINAYAGFDSDTLTINVNNVTGGSDGIDTDHYGSGSLSITATGDVTGTAYNGIDAYAGVDSVNLTINANNVTGGSDGIDADHYGFGALSITATGDVTGTTSDGINAYAGFDSDNLTINVNNATGGQRGIDASHFGLGNLSITASGNVTGTNGDGIDAYAGFDGTDTTISVNNVTGSQNGIKARNYGFGTLSITTTGDVTGASDDGIYAYAGFDSNGLTIDVVNVTGDDNGINANNDGFGALSITATGDVTGTNDDGIYANVSKYGTNLAINANNVSGGDNGIEANHNGTGSLSITSTGTATGSDKYGIRAFNSTNATDLTIEAQDVSGGKYGVRATNTGSGSLSITTTGDVVGGTGSNFLNSGIGAYNSGGSDALTISANTVTGGKYGIQARNNGSGALTISATGLVTGQDYDGIRTTNSNASTDTTITVVDVTGYQDGINITHYGTGALTVTATGTVTGTNGDGIDAGIGRNATDVVINANNVTANRNGIVVGRDGSGDVDITVSGTLNAGLVGIDVTQYSGGVSVATSGVVTAQDVGIDVYSRGSGATTITATQAITSQSSTGVLVRNSYDTTGLTISTTDVTGVRGINATHYGTGVLSITSSGQITATNGLGVIAGNYSSANGATGTDIIIDVNAVNSTSTGIAVDHRGTGVIDISASGPVTSSNNSGLSARNDGTATDISITVADVTGAERGILVENNGTGDTTIIASGAITGGSEAGIETEGQDSTTTFITLDNGASVNSDNGVAINNDAGASVVTANVGSAILDDVTLGDGTDTLTLAGGTVDPDAILDGGDALTDSLIISGDGYALNSANLINWEDVTIDGGTVSFTDNTGPATGDAPLSIINAGVLNANAAFVLNDDLLLATGGRFVGAGGGAGVYTLNGDVSNDGGILSTQDGAAGDVLTINGNLTGNGAVQIDTALGDDASDTDILAITGDTSGTSTLTVANAGGTGDVTTLGIEVITVGGASDAEFILAGDFETDDGDQAVIAGAFAYTLQQSADGNWALLSSAAPVDPDDIDDDDAGDDGVGGAGNGGNDDPLFQPNTSLFEAFPQILLSANTLPSLKGRTTNRQGSSAQKQKSAFEALGDIVQYPLWFQLEGGTEQFVPVESTVGAEADTTSFTLRSGLDYSLGAVAGGEVVAGVNLTYTDMRSDVTSDIGDGRIDTTNFGIGWSATWYGSNDIYVDAQAQYSTSNTDIASDTLGDVINGLDGTGASASIEVGRTYAINPTLLVTPQAQLTYATVDFDDFTGPNDERVSIDNAESLKLRLGVTADYALETPYGDQNLYGFVNVTRELADAPQVDVSGVTLTSQAEDWTAQIGLGGRYDISDSTTLFGDVSYATGLENVNESRAINASLSLRLEF